MQQLRSRKYRPLTVAFRGVVWLLLLAAYIQHRLYVRRLKRRGLAS
jgi:hypothetical protein